MKINDRFIIVAIVAFLFLAVPAGVADIIWPADNDWTAIKIGADNYFDNEGDQHPDAIDLIGTTSSYSAGYWAYAENATIYNGALEDLFMIRMRVGGNGGNYAWQAHLETDGDSTNVEWIFQLVQSGNPSNQGVELIKTAVGGTTLQDVDIGSNSASWLGDEAVFARWSAVPSTTHFHLDFAIPWSEFETITGVSDLGDLRLVLSTSSSHSGINKDAPLGGALTDQISNALSESIPEPTVATLLLGAGTGMIAFRRLFNRETKDQEDT
jgi:hypothetical protein